MGLGAPKRRAKLSQDPNNTTWSRSTANFGHRILSQQGWQPGQYLGAENANHSEHYTAANASHIRILLREDNLGVGAKVGGNKAETFGLSLFSGVLGRLNGKSDELVQKQQDSLRDAELRQYQVGKHGYMNFVSGGLLVGDRIEKKGEKDVAQAEDVQNASEAAVKKGKKRKADGDDLGAGAKTKKEKKARKVEDSVTEDVDAQADSGAESRAERSRRKGKKRQQRPADMPDGDDPSETAIGNKKSSKQRKKALGDDETPPETSADDKARLKQEKRARKEDRRKRKEAKRLKRAQKAQRVEQQTQPIVQSVNGGRHAVRHRYIQQKRMAGMDAQAMREIFMIKGAA